MYKILLEFVVYDKEDINHYNLINECEPCYSSLFFFYNDNNIKEKYINLLKNVKNVNHTQIYIDMTEEEFFYYKLKYPNEMDIIEYFDMMLV